MISALLKMLCHVDLLVHQDGSRRAHKWQIALVQELGETFHPLRPRVFIQKGIKQTQSIKASLRH